MPVIKLTKATISKLRSAAKPIVYFDRDLKGFGIKIFPSGVRRWIVEYRPGAGGRGVPKKRMVIGSADVLTPDEARKEAAETLAQVRLGNDPAEEKTRLRASATMAELLESYMADEIRPVRKASTAALYQIYIDK